jgi:Domain of unknown function (DUF1990)
MPDRDTKQTQSKPSALARIISALTGWIEKRGASNASNSKGSSPRSTRDRSTTIQPVEDGKGPIIERSYRVNFTSALKPEALMQIIKANLADFSPETLASFEKSSGQPWTMRVGDEYQITILGPWNGGVRVIESAPTAFSFVTLEGHPEAGTIRFSIAPHPSKRGVFCFEIRSKARARDTVVQIAYNAMNAGPSVQESAWTTFCERVVETSGGKAIGPVEVSTLETNSAQDDAPEEDALQKDNAYAPPT